MSAGGPWQGQPSGPGGWREPYREGGGWDDRDGGRDTGERLRAALSARSAQVRPDGPLGAPRHGYDRDGYTRADDGSGWSSGSGRGGSGGSGSGRPRLLPGWAKLTLAVGLVLSAALGIVLGLRSSDDSAPALPPARETSYGEDRARVAITSFVRQGRFVTLELELTNLAPLGSDNSWSVNNAFADSGYDLSGIRLLDPTSGASYRPAEDGKGDCLCSKTVSLTIEAGSSSRVSAQFPAPAPSVKQLTVDIPGAGSFGDVRLS